VEAKPLNAHSRLIVVGLTAVHVCAHYAGISVRLFFPDLFVII